MALLLGSQPLHPTELQSKPLRRSLPRACRSRAAKATTSFPSHCIPCSISVNTAILGQRRARSLHHNQNSKLSWVSTTPAISSSSIRIIICIVASSHLHLRCLEAVPRLFQHDKRLHALFCCEDPGAAIAGNPPAPHQALVPCRNLRAPGSARRLDHE
ncbi:hypothetical protein BD311DRAFT_129114 [Dichomitus squalens]|uniref:Uncharacterized protein n=1 Tax=Dichomitus squalens TaxID=114155 RepID=A0A4Q9M6S9_9APHY|nr:hypothetical protein BD311DRAFT_129114 [Dichomitus squalens]